MTESAWAQGRTILQMLDDLPEEVLTTWKTGRILLTLDLLRDKAISDWTFWKVAENELRATQRLQRLAAKHEDLRLAQGLAEDAAYLAEVLPVYQTRWSRSSHHWHRLWRHLQDRADASDPPP